MGNKDGRTKLQKDFDYLLEELVVRWGLCIRLKAKDILPPGKILTADAFAEVILLAEGSVPEYEKQRFRFLRNIFIERYGGHSISEETYQT